MTALQLALSIQGVALCVLAIGIVGIAPDDWRKLLPQRRRRS